MWKNKRSENTHNNASIMQGKCMLTETRMRPVIELKVAEEQTGFRKKTTDATFTFN